MPDKKDLIMMNAKALINAIHNYLDVVRSNKDNSCENLARVFFTQFDVNAYPHVLKNDYSLSTITIKGRHVLVIEKLPFVSHEKTIRIGTLNLEPDVLNNFSNSFRYLVEYLEPIFIN